MLNVQFDWEALRQVIRDEVREAVIDTQKVSELPPLLTRKELMELLHIGPTKTSELLARSDFPVFREAGLLIPTNLLFKWIEKNTQWVEENTKYLSVI
ncbi:DNA-binding protein [Psychrobacillus sp. NPDC096426]|uniref:DNA-binding protein n=1 Tax=Psychrobacillus sp. NPDC096426 TaxID=3364491 RepID=UPI00380D8D22